MSCQFGCSPLILSNISGLINPDAIWLKIDQPTSFDLFQLPLLPPWFFFPGWGFPHRCQSELLSLDLAMSSHDDAAVHPILGYIIFVPGSISTDPVGFALWGRILLMISVLICLADLPDVRSIFLSSIARFFDLFSI